MTIETNTAIVARLTPPEREALAKNTIKLQHGDKRRRDHNQSTIITALQCIEHGLPVVDVHSIEDGGPCTCQWAVKKNAKEGRPAPKPCTERNWGKHPRGLSWQQGKTTERDAIIARWGGAMGYFNVGIVFGGDVNIALVDEDGPTGAATTEAWRADPGKGMPATVTVITGSGGHHYYYRIPAEWDIRNSSKALGGGIDLRGTNGFSVAPGSRHWSGVASNWADGKGLYEWMDGRSPDDIGIADAPVWMLRKMWFATVSRRHETAPDGSRWEQADLGDWTSDDDKATGTVKREKSTGSDAKSDPFDKALASESVDGGWEGHAATIGHGPGLNGFDGPIYRAACSFFGKEGHDADDESLRVVLVARIKVAPEDDQGHRDRYLTDDYLDGRIQQARDFVKSKGGEAIKIKGQAHGWPFGFVSDGEHLCYTRPPKKDGDACEQVPMCVLFEVIGRTLNETAEAAFGTLIAFTDEHGKAREVTLLDSDIAADTGPLMARLRDVGFWIDNTTEAKAKFLTCLGRLKSETVITVASKPGWHGGTFLTPHGDAIGSDRHMRLADDMKSSRGAHSAGTLDGWRDNAASLMFFMDAHGTVILASAFAGPILALLERPSCGIAVTGTSSAGKTLSQKFAATVWGDLQAGQGVFVQIRGTANGLEVIAARASGSNLQIDELKGAKADQIGEILMMLSGGVSANRQDGNQGLRAKLTWHAFFVMSAEESIRELIENSRGSYVTGYAVRAVEIDTSGAAKFEPQGWVDALGDQMKQHWGHAGPAFVSYLINEGYVKHPEKMVKRLDAALAWLLDGASGDGAKGRAAGVLAYALVGGELAQEAGIMPWEGSDWGEWLADGWHSFDRDEGMLRRSFRSAWNTSWGSEEGTPENSPEAAWRRLQGRVASEWHLHSKDEDTFAKGADAEKYGDGEPRLAKWFFTGTPYQMTWDGKDAKSAMVNYIAITQEAFRFLIKSSGVKESGLLRYARAEGLLLPNGKNNTWNKLPGYRALDNYRFKVGTFGPLNEAEALADNAAGVIG